MKFTDDNKYLFGAYLNMAYDNFLDVIKHVSIPEKGDVKTLCDRLGKNNSSSQKIEAKLFQSFPFLECLNVYFSDFSKDGISTGELCTKCLNDLSERLNAWRNYTTHYHHNEIVEDALITQLLEKTYEQALDNVRQRFKPSSDEIAHLFRRDKKKIVIPPFYQLVDENKRLTEKGLAFFTCLFLHKRDAYHFLKAMKGFKRTDERKYRFTLETFTIMRFHAPRRLMKLQQRSGDKVSLAMDMINELSKCPSELYPCLTEENKKQFEVYLDEKSDVKEVLGERIRYKDRYEILALKALEYSEECKEMGFYVHFGKCYMKSYEKTYIDNSKDNRYIVFPLSGFGRIQNSYFTESETEFKYLSLFGSQLADWSKMRVQHTTYEDCIADAEVDYAVPYISEAYPSYIVNDNKIGIRRLNTSCDTVFPSFHLDNEKVYCSQPHYWLSKYELPAMVFYSYLKNKHKNLLNELPTIWNLFENNSPIRTKREKDVAKIKEDRINSYITDTDEKLESLPQKDKKGMKNGQIADELARDILWLQPSKDGGKNKLTGANFQVFQYALARYSFKKNELMDIFRKAGMIGADSNTTHPFLAKVKPTHDSLVDYYKSYLEEKKKYLEEKKKYLEEKQKKIAVGKSNTPFYPFRKLNKQPECDVEVPEYPKFLSRNLFTNSIQEALIKVRGDLENEIKLTLSKSERINVSKLMQIYFEKFCKDGLPKVYTENRIYRYCDKTQKMGDALSLKEREACIKEMKESKKDLVNLKHIIENEKQIRLRGVQDISIYLWMKDLMPESIKKIFESKKEIVESERKISLGDLDNSVLAEKIDFEKIVNKPVGLKIKGKVKLKDYGRLDSLLRDTLPSSLLDFMVYLYQKILKEKRAPLSYEYIHKELEAFAHYQPKVIELVQKIEQNIIWLIGDKAAKEENGGYFKFSKLTENEALKNKDGLFFNAELLNTIRNCFCHNNYPSGSKDCDLLTKSFEPEQILKIIQSNLPANKNTEDRKLENTLAHCLYKLIETEKKKIDKMLVNGNK